MEVRLLKDMSAATVSKVSFFALPQVGVLVLLTD
jgi:hypothetical protein